MKILGTDFSCVSPENKITWTGDFIFLGNTPFTNNIMEHGAQFILLMNKVGIKKQLLNCV